MNWFENITYLVIEANSSCNLHCRTCNRDDLVDKGWRKKKNIEEAEFRYLLEQLKNCPIDTIKFEGLSEPMLHPNFAQLCMVLREYFPQAFTIIATNLQYQVAATPLLKTLPFVDMVYLSIDGTRSTYEWQRTGAQYSRLMRSLAYIKTHVAQEVRQKKLHINFTLTPQNYTELPAIYELRDLYQLASVRINLAQNWSEGSQNSNQFDQSIIDFLKPYTSDVKGVGGWEYKDCFWPFSGIVIDVYGDVRQCLLNTSQEPLGNAFTMPVRDIFNQSERLQMTRQMLRQNEAPSNCRTCDYHYLSKTLQEILGGKYNVNQPRTVKR